MCVNLKVQIKSKVKLVSKLERLAVHTVAAKWLVLNYPGGIKFSFRIYVYKYPAPRWVYTLNLWILTCPTTCSSHLS